VVTKGIVMQPGAPSTILRKRVTRTAMADGTTVAVTSDGEETYRDTSGELRFVNSDGEEIDPDTKQVKSYVTDGTSYDEAVDTVKEKATSKQQDVLADMKKQAKKTAADTAEEAEEEVSVVVVSNS